jgi:hypothetical protein
MIDQQFEPALARLEVRLVRAAATRFLFPDQRELVLDALYALRRQHWVPRDVAPLWGLAGEQHPKAKLTWAAVRAIRRSREPDTAVAAHFGVTRSAVWSVRAGRTWKEHAA